MRDLSSNNGVLGCDRCFILFTNSPYYLVGSFFEEICRQIYEKDESEMENLRRFLIKFFSMANENEINCFFAHCIYNGVGVDQLFSRLSSIFSERELRFLFPRLPLKARDKILRESFGKNLWKLCPGLLNTWLS